MEADSFICYMYMARRVVLLGLFPNRRTATLILGELMQVSNREESHERNLCDLTVQLDECRSEVSETRLWEHHELRSLIADIAYDLEKGPRFDPLERLPVEVWSEVLLNVATRERQQQVYLVDFNEVLVLTLVSTSWCDKILSFPRFWNDIRVDLDAEDAHMKLEMALYLSKSMKITLYLFKQLESFLSCDFVATSLAPARSRITSLQVYEHNPLEIERFLPEILRKLQLAGSLMHWNIVSNPPWQPYPYLDHFICSTKALHTAKGIMLTDSLLQNYPIRNNLRNVCTRTLHASMPLLENMESLREVSVTPDYRPEVLPLSTIFEQYRRPPLKWSSLQTGGDADLYITILSRLASTLVDLTIDISVATLPKYLLVLSGLGALQALDIKLRGHIPATMAEDSGNASRPASVRELSIRFNLSHMVNSAQQDMLSHIFHLHFPRVRKLYFWGNDIGLVFVQETGFQEVESIYLNTNTFPLGNQQYLPASCRSLLVNSQFDVASKLRSDTLQRVEVEVLTFGMLKSQTYLNVDITQWPSLRYLKLHGGSLMSLHHLSAPLLHLTNLCIATSDHVIDIAITGVCQQLALYPWVCPALHTLSFGLCPEWDILFIMLEGRNLFPQYQVSKFRSITLPVRIPAWLAQHVCGLLRGKRVKRPSNRDISLVGNANIALDPNM